MKPRTLSGLKAHNTRLTRKIGELQNERDVRGLHMQNSLSDLVQAAAFQTNLTSFNPIIQNNIYAPLTINWTMLTYMYKTHGVIQTAIDVPVLDALRGGVEIESKELDADDIKALLDAMEENDDLSAAGEAMTWARLYGGGAVIANTEQDGIRPLQENRIKVLEFYPVNRWELGAGQMIPDQAPPVGDPNAAPKDAETYNFYGNRLHRSRVFTLSGKAAPYIIRWQLQGWGMSEIERMVEDFNLYIKTKNVLYELLNEAKTDVFMFEGFKNSLATQAGTQLVKRRVDFANQLKSFQNALVMDKNDVYEQKQLTFAGIAEVMKENRVGIAAAVRIPMTKLFGISASGFNSGEDDIENYNSMVESEVRQKLRHIIRKMIRLRMIQLFGKEYDFDFKFKALRVMSSKEEEEIKKSKHERYLQDYDRQLLSSEEYGQVSQKEGLIPIETDAARGLLEDHPVAPGMEGGGEFGEEDPDGGKPTGKDKKEGDDGK